MFVCFTVPVINISHGKSRLSATWKPSVGKSCAYPTPHFTHKFLVLMVQNAARAVCSNCAPMMFQTFCLILFQKALWECCCNMDTLTLCKLSSSSNWHHHHHHHHHLAAMGSLGGGGWGGGLNLLQPLNLGWSTIRVDFHWGASGHGINQQSFNGGFTGLLTMM